MCFKIKRNNTVLAGGASRWRLDTGDKLVARIFGFCALGGCEVVPGILPNKNFTWSLTQPWGAKLAYVFNLASMAVLWL